MGKELYTAKQFIAAIPGTGGFIIAIAKRVGCVRHTAAKYIRKYATVQQAVEDEREAMLDSIEAEAYKQAKSGDSAMIRYILSTKGKSRGYVERQEVSGPDGGPIQFRAEDLSDDELAAIATRGGKGAAEAQIGS